MFKILRNEFGRAIFCRENEDGSATSFSRESPVFEDLLKWNDAQPADKKLDLSDQPPTLDPAAQTRADAVAVLKALKAKPKAERTAGDRAAALDAVLELLA